MDRKIGRSAECTCTIAQSFYALEASLLLSPRRRPRIMRTLPERLPLLVRFKSIGSMLFLFFLEVTLSNESTIDGCNLRKIRRDKLVFQQIGD